MNALATATTCGHAELAIATTGATQFLDLTERVESFVRHAGVACGMVNVQVLHTTAAIVLNEHEPLLLADFTRFLSRLVPEQGPFQHDDPVRRTVNLSPGEPANGHAHCRALLLPASACINIVGGRLRLGRWQRIFLVELDGPRSRRVSLSVFGAAETAAQRSCR